MSFILRDQLLLLFLSIAQEFLWRRQLAEFANERRVIALDLLPHGATAIDPDRHFSFEAQAAMLLQFLDALDIDQIDLVANDSGAGIALVFAANYPQRLRSLTLTNASRVGNRRHFLSREVVTLAGQNDPWSKEEAGA
jgi:pimeloyl-ACP methyl ester carboxylesterase